MKTKRQKENIPHESSAAKKSKTSKKNDDVNLITQLDSIYLVKHSSVIIDFWNICISIDPKSPNEAFNSLNSLKLVGPFRYLNDFYSKSKETKNINYLCVDRFSTDLPEMQTFAIYKGGRFCFWRDLPNEEPNLIINISNNQPNFPTFTIAGNGDPLSVLTFLGCLKKQKFENIFKKVVNQSEIMSKWKIYQQKKFLEELRKNRKEITVGEPLHGLGIKVEIVGDCGYRPVTENTKKLRNDLIDFATTNDETQKAKLKQQLLQLYSFVTIANDEMDFGMGLEFGHDLFISNYECFDAMTKNVLEVTYKLLKREVFAKILKEQWENGRRINEDKKVI
uniref:Uncharacterized protein n=1 Tax=Meloidogyne incognita TaxID=6306 RepID=A0A914NLV1_MELIC